MVSVVPRMPSPDLLSLCPSSCTHVHCFKPKLVFLCLSSAISAHSFLYIIREVVHVQLSFSSLLSSSKFFHLPLTAMWKFQSHFHIRIGYLWQQSPTSNTKSCGCFLIATQQISIKLAAYNNAHLLPHSFYGSRPGFTVYSVIKGSAGAGIGTGSSTGEEPASKLSSFLQNVFSCGCRTFGSLLLQSPWWRGRLQCVS